MYDACYVPDVFIIIFVQIIMYFVHFMLVVIFLIVARITVMPCGRIISQRFNGN